MMTDTASGEIVYGVLRFGGFLDIGSDCYPIPFGRLRHDHRRADHVAGLTREQPKGASARQDGGRTDRKWRRRSCEDYGGRPAGWAGCKSGRAGSFMDRPICPVGRTGADLERVWDIYETFCRKQG